KVHDCGSRNHTTYLGPLAVKLGLNEHTKPYHSRIVNFYADLDGANIGVEDSSDITDASLKNSSGVCVQANLSLLVEGHYGQIVLRDSGFVEQNLGPRQLRHCQRLIGNCLSVVREGFGEVGALHTYQKLPLLDGVAQPCADLYDPPGSHRNHRYAARYIGANY